MLRFHNAGVIFSLDGFSESQLAPTNGYGTTIAGFLSMQLPRES